MKRRTRKTAALEQVRELYRREPLHGFFKESGSKGGKKRTKLLSPDDRREIARKAALTRWRRKAK